VRRYVIYGLLGLLVVVLLNDFQTASDEQTLAAIPTLVRVITATPGPIPNTPLPTVGIVPTQPPTEVAVLAPPADAPNSLNGLALDSIIVMPDSVKAHIREIYALGQSLGNNPHAFSKLGDSTIEAPYFLSRFDGGDYKLGDYAYLQAVIDYYAGSFARNSVAIRRGLHTWSVLDPMWAPKPICDPGEHMLACEFRLNKPSVVLIHLGSNDAGIPDSTDKHLREIIDYTLSMGVIPILATKADRAEGPGNINNNIIRQIASDYNLPLWDYDTVAGTLPGRGLTVDNVHMTSFYAHDYSQPEAFQRGQSVQNLTALIALDRVWRTLSETEN
jgi:hypothetical protein